MPKPELQTARDRLDGINDRLFQRIKDLDPRISLTRQLEDVTYLQRFYSLVSSRLKSETIRPTFSSPQPDSRAIERILSGSDFTEISLTFIAISDLIKSYLDIADTDLGGLLADRFSIVEEIAYLKRSSNSPMRNQEREIELMARADAICESFELPLHLGSMLYRKLIFPASFELEEMIMHDDN